MISHRKDLQSRVITRILAGLVFLLIIAWPAQFVWGQALDVISNGDTLVHVENSGNVGIGTTSPSSKLWVNGRVSASSFASTSPLIFEAPVGTERMRIDDTNGNVGIGTLSPNTKLTVAGVITPDANGTRDIGNSTFRWREIFATNGTINTSDKRLKENIKDMPYGLAEVLQLHPVSYTWKDQPELGTKLGVIAQEIQSSIKEVVKVGDDPEQTLGIYYSDLIPVLIKALQEQQEIIERQNAEITAKIAQFESALQKLSDVTGVQVNAAAEKTAFVNTETSTLE